MIERTNSLEGRKLGWLLLLIIVAESTMHYLLIFITLKLLFIQGRVLLVIEALRHRDAGCGD